MLSPPWELCFWLKKGRGDVAFCLRTGIYPARNSDYKMGGGELTCKERYWEFDILSLIKNC